MEATGHITTKGAATRARIIEAAADLVLARGAAGTSLDDIRAGTSTSKSQLFHYFPGGKTALVGAIAAFQSERVLDAQRPFLDSLDTWESWEGWRRAVVAHYGSQTHLTCPISALTSEVAGKDAVLAAELGEHMDRWRGYLEAGVERMRTAGSLRSDIDPRIVTLSVFAALQGGLLLMQAMQSLEPLEAGLQGAMEILRAAADGQPAKGRRRSTVTAGAHPEVGRRR
jgi:AcrR family transcriptional regulator